MQNSFIIDSRLCLEELEIEETKFEALSVYYSGTDICGHQCVCGCLQCFSC